MEGDGGDIGSIKSLYCLFYTTAMETKKWLVRLKNKKCISLEEKRHIKVSICAAESEGWNEKERVFFLLFLNFF